MRLEFDADINPLAGSGSNGSLGAGDHRVSRTISLTGSPSRFSLARARRAISDQDDE